MKTISSHRIWLVVTAATFCSSTVSCKRSHTAHKDSQNAEIAQEQENRETEAVSEGITQKSDQNLNELKILFERYSSAKNVQELEPCILNFTEVFPQIDRHHQKGYLKRIISNIRIVDNFSDDHQSYQRIRVTITRNNNLGREITYDRDQYIKKTSDGLKVDWIASNGFNSSSWELLNVERNMFCSRLRVLAELSDYYNYGFGDARNAYYSLRLLDAEETSAGRGYVLKDSGAGRMIFSKLKDGGIVQMTVLASYPEKEIKWASDANLLRNPDLFLEIDEFVGFHWYPETPSEAAFRAELTKNKKRSQGSEMGQSEFAKGIDSQLHYDRLKSSLSKLDKAKGNSIFEKIVSTLPQSRFEEITKLKEVDKVEFNSVREFMAYFCLAWTNYTPASDLDVKKKWLNKYFGKPKNSNLSDDSEDNSLTWTYWSLRNIDTAAAGENIYFNMDSGSSDVNRQISIAFGGPERGYLVKASGITEKTGFAVDTSKVMMRAPAAMTTFFKILLEEK